MRVLCGDFPLGLELVLGGCSIWSCIDMILTLTSVDWVDRGGELKRERSMVGKERMWHEGGVLHNEGCVLQCECV